MQLPKILSEKFPIALAREYIVNLNLSILPIVLRPNVARYFEKYFSQKIPQRFRIWEKFFYLFHNLFKYQLSKINARVTRWKVKKKKSEHAEIWEERFLMSGITRPPPEGIASEFGEEGKIMFDIVQSRSDRRKYVKLQVERERRGRNIKGLFHLYCSKMYFDHNPPICGYASSISYFPSDRARPFKQFLKVKSFRRTESNNRERERERELKKIKFGTPTGSRDGIKIHNARILEFVKFSKETQRLWKIAGCNGFKKDDFKWQKSRKRTPRKTVRETQEDLRESGWKNSGRRRKDEIVSHRNQVPKKGENFSKHLVIIK